MKIKLEHLFPDLDESRIIAGEMKLMRRAGYTYLEYKKNLGKIKELNTHPIMELTENYRSNWKNHILGMAYSRIPFKILCYQQKVQRYLGRPFKCWH
jgi:hypothetical protein